MISLRWYAGIAKDIEAIKDGEGIVLHADNNVCRVLHKIDNKICLTGYASKEKLNIVAHNGHPIFSFNKVEYSGSPSFVYGCADPGDGESVKQLYKRYCEVGKDKQLDDFLYSRQRQKSSKENPISFDEQRFFGRFLVVITLNGIALGQVEIIFRMEDTGKDNPDRKVVEFNKQAFLNDLHQLMHNYDEPPGIEEEMLIMDNILQGFAEELNKTGVYFDPNEFNVE